MSQISVHHRLIKDLPFEKSPLGRKPKDLTRRRREARRLSELMACTPNFSFVRLGDMQLTMLLGHQLGLKGPVEETHETVSGVSAHGNVGLSMVYAERMWESFERATYVDYCDRMWPNTHLLPRLHLSRSNVLHRNPDPETSYIFLTWMEHEFREYCEDRCIGMVGAEVRLLEQLLKDPEYRSASRGIWPSSATWHFFQPRDDGSNLDDNLDATAEDLRHWIRATGVDTVFVSLGGAAKILCVELASELGVRMFDFGALLRGLTYSRSPGNRSCRGSHLPFLFKLPFELWCTALEIAYPQLSDQQLLAKLHAQLILELQMKELGWTHASWEFDFSAANIRNFRDAHRRYRSRYSSKFHGSTGVQQERARFLEFCGQHSLTVEGRLFRGIALTKKRLSNALINW
ncbi:MAG: hypothetical protein GTO41_11645 [Burkholderiales bacterium]|nr:hypothetical protein [Burkholderiales bacterium]